MQNSNTKERNAAYYQQHKEAILEKKRIQRINATPISPEKRQERLAWHANYREKNRELLREKYRQFYQANRERRLKDARLQHEKNIESRKAYYAAYREAHREQAKQYRFNRRLNATEEQKAKWNSFSKARLARKNNATSNSSAEAFYIHIRSLKKVNCYYCGRIISGKEAHIDHVIALNKRGNHSSENLCASCPKCNLKKNDRLPSEIQFLDQPLLNL